MKVLFATTNPAKVKKYKDLLAEKGIELITIKDLDFKLPIDENGKNAIENAYIKAKTYYDKTKIPTIGMDNNLFIEELAEEKADSLTVVKVNVDDSPETAGAFSIMSIPTVILFKDGQVVDKLVGYTTKENLIAKFGL